MADSASFGDWLRRRRKALDLTQDALAAKVGCSVGLIRKIEGDERRPSRQVAELLATVLQISPNEQDNFLKLARAQRQTDPLAPQPTAVDALPVLESMTLRSQIADPIAPERRAGLPIPSTPLVGREREIQTVIELLANPECRLLTIVGTGGMGKTRLALAIAAAQQTAFAQGAYFVALASLSTPDLIAPAIANALGLTLTGAPDLKRQLINLLGTQQMLLVLDNLEHLVEGVGWLSELIAYAAGVTVLATSRERLNLQGEWLFELQGLPLPPIPAGKEQSTALARYSAVALFVRSAQRTEPGFTLTAENAAAVARICRLVDGLPLGIELAAAWVHLLSCQEIAAEIERSIDFLAVNRRDVPTRHRSLRAVFDHSWRLITPEEQHVLAALSVFRGGFTREAAAQVAHASLTTLASLVSRSLVWRAQAGRYDLHELVRQYTAAKMSEMLRQPTDHQRRSEEQDPAWAHARYFLNLALAAEQKLSGAEQIHWLDQLEQEHDNLRAVLDWACANGQQEMGLRLATALMWFWSQRDYRREGRQQLKQQLDASATADLPLLRAHALNAAAYLAYEENDHHTASLLYNAALAISHTLPDPLLSTQILLRLAHVAFFLGDHSTAHTLSAQATSAMRMVDDPSLVASVLIGLGDLARQQTDYVKAQTLYHEGIALTRRLQSTNLLAYALRQAGQTALRLGDTTNAAALCRESLLLNQAARSKQGVIACLALLAAVMNGRGQPRRAAQLFGGVAAQLAAIAEPLLPLDQAEYVQSITSVQGKLAPIDYALAWQSGQAMTLAQAIAYALVD
ncbi:MAG: helix-turn-helix domain-containing protein [Caldilineaceae bacterium]